MIRDTVTLFILTTLLSAGACGIVYGEEKPITEIDLDFSWDKAPKGGELVGQIQADSKNKQLIIEGSEYAKKDDTWIFGERPVVEVDLSAKEGYYFDDLTSSAFTLSGCSVTYQSVEIEEDGSYLTLRVRLPKIDGTLPKTTAASWDGHSASWDAVGGARGYEVTLYRNGTPVTSASTKDISYDLSPYITTKGTYTFAVRATGYYSSQAGPWVTCDDIISLSEEDAWLCDNGTWKQTGDERRYIYKDNSYPVSTWRSINGKWYYFDKDGCMVSDCYVQSPDDPNTYRFIGENGSWEKEKDTERPNRALYEIY